MCLCCVYPIPGPDDGEGEEAGEEEEKKCL